MALQANAQGELAGKFMIPANIPAGVKNINFVGNTGGRANATFVGQGESLVNITRLLTLTTVINGTDPLAQTFSLPEATPVGGVDLFFTAKGTSKIVVQIRGVSNGVPTSQVLTEQRLLPAAITVVGSTRVAFPAPVWLEANIEYALVVLCDDAVTALAIAELGKYDVSTQRWVTSQPYQVGVLLSSSNASTWTPHQDRDLTFRLLKAVFSQNERVVNLGNTAVTGATDLLLLTAAEIPTFNSRIEYTLGLPNGSTVVVAENQPVRLPAPITGNVAVSAKLIGNAASSPVLMPGAQLISGAVQLANDYVTIAIPAGPSSRVRVIFEATLPSGAAVAVKVSGIDAGDTYQTVPFLSSSPVTATKQEITHELTGVSEAFVKVKLELTGTASARPLVENLRVIVV